ncbi:MAG TPA: PAS domain-containing protein [Gemmatimonadales bacterium]|nr:PAS domain-containing protein [Gemmatimonadales bacterium]
MCPEIPDSQQPVDPARAGAIDLQARRDFLATLVEQVEDYAIFLLSPEGHNATWGPAVERIFGYSKAEFIGQSVAQLFTPEDRAAGEPQRELREARERGKASDDRWLMRKDGSRVWAQGMTTALYGPDGDLIGYGKVLRDLTQQRLAEEALARSEQRRQLALMAADVGTGIYDLETRQLELDENVRRMLGMHPGEPVRSLDTVLAHIHPDDRHRLIEAVQAAVATEGRFEVEVRAIAPDGTMRWLRGRGKVLADETGTARMLAGSAVDLTERRELERRLQESQRMDAVGQLAGGVAHEVNNMMTVILGITDILLSGPGAAALPRRDLEQIRTAAARAAAVTGQLLAFSRRQMLQPTAVRLDALIAQMEPVLRRILGEDKELVVRFAPRIEPVRVDARQVEQVVINLALNARDAMGYGGRLTIGLSTDDVDPAFRHRHGQSELSPGSYVVLSVRDTGHGMDDVTRERIFEPFFTTKPVGAGAGLGLAVAYGIVRQSGGQIFVESEPGRGTEFEVYFPVAPEPTGAGARRASSTILLVEDEPMLRDWAARILEHGGYHCLQAASAKEALQIAESRLHEIDLAIIDLVMPQMSGRELGETLHRLRPELPILYMSGYGDEDLARRDLMRAGAPLLQKPVDARTLLERVQSVLAGSQRTPPGS